MTTKRLVVFAACVLASSGPARADSTDTKALAEQLFNQGRDLSKAGDWVGACPKFEASARIEPVLGTRLNLATCYERVGKLASAWALYRELIELFVKAGDTKRRDYAAKQAAALEPRLPRLKLIAPQSLPSGFAVTRSGVPIDPMALGTELYVDPGSYEIVVSAPGFELVTETVTAVEGKSTSITIRNLAPAKAKQPTPPPRPENSSTPTRTAESSDVVPPAPPRTRAYVGIGAIAGGAVFAATGLVFGFKARSTWDDARTVCPELTCNTAEFDRGRSFEQAARHDATVSTVLIGTGAAVATVGVVLWVTAPKRSSAGSSDDSISVRPVFVTNGGGFALAGRF